VCLSFDKEQLDPSSAASKFT